MTVKVPHLEPLANVLKEIIKRNLIQTGKINLTEEITLDWKNIIEYGRKMRVSSLEKFNAPGYVSGVAFYASAKDKEENKAAGTLLLYIEEEFIEVLFKALGHSGFDDDPEEKIAEKCGQFLKTVAEQFLSEVQSHGYRNLILSDVLAERNVLTKGIDFPYDQYQQAELTYTLKGRKILISELSLTSKK